MDKIPAALYARKSADETMSPSSDTGNQVEEIKLWAEQNGFTIVAEYIDEGVKGWTIDRPGLKAIKSAIREKPRRFDALIVSAWDRLSRDVGDAFLLTGELEAFGVRLISVRQGDPQDENAKLGMAMYFLLSMLENKTRGGHTLAGSKRWASEGYAPGGSAPFGYYRKRVKDTKGVERVRYAPDTEQAGIVRDIYRWYADGSLLTHIARKLNNMGIATVRGKGWSANSIFNMLFLPNHRDKYLGGSIHNFV